ncbi:hypothetical protein AB205_0219850 [Aquarana catesbeiana]|uniref:Sulfotransferase n=1 Tax=Aquarana catesbeiana TaxID=8400 RepID=A0A2G9QE84_AQUCT|nr:hypothetical protein AB205_0219850 [Aquarana catesbeiana]
MNSTSSEWRRQDLVNVRGVPMFCAFAHNLDEIINHFQAREDDIVIATYPKSGTTWMSEIVDLVLNDGDIEKSRRDAIFQKVPMLEFRVPGEVPPGICGDWKNHFTVAQSERLDEYYQREMSGTDLTFCF